MAVYSDFESQLATVYIILALVMSLLLYFAVVYTDRELALYNGY
jgi:hypothetical protein